MIASSHNSWVNKIKPQNVINSISLPMLKFEPSADFELVSLFVCQEYPNKFELGYNKAISAKKEPKKWKFSIIGVAYLGELEPRNS